MKPEFAFIGDSLIAFWPLEVYFPQWECLNFGIPGGGLNHIELFTEDVSNCNAVIEFGTNDIYSLNEENIDAYVERYVSAILSIPTRQTYLFSLLPRNDYDGESGSVNRFIVSLNQKIQKRIESTHIIYMNVFDRLLLNGRLNPDLTIDNVHLNSKGYRILTEYLKSVATPKP